MGRAPRPVATNRGCVLLILIAGPLRGGTNDDPTLIEANIAAMTDTALQLYHLGHLPLLGEWISLPLIEAAGSKRVGDPVYNEIQHPIAEKLLTKCDGCLRIGGPSSGADHMVETTRSLSKPVWFDLSELPPSVQKTWQASRPR